MFLETIPDLPSTEVVQQKLEAKVKDIQMKDSAASAALKTVLLDHSHGFLSKGSPLVPLGKTIQGSFP